MSKQIRAYNLDFNLKKILFCFFLFFAFYYSIRMLFFQTASNAILFSDPNKLLEGDIAFRKGTGIFSDFFSQIGKEPSPYSHVGIVVTQNGKLFVIHAIADDFTGIGQVSQEPLDVFFNSNNSGSGAIYRLRSGSPRTRMFLSQKAKFLWQAKTPFDTDFDLSNPNRLYCTELVWVVYREAGIHLVEAPDELPKHLFQGKNKKVISISNLLKCNDLYPVTAF